MRILFDLDGTLLDWGKNYDRHLDTHWSHLTNIARTSNQRTFNLLDGLSEDERQAVLSVLDTPGFYAELEPYPGAVEAVLELADDGHTIHFATSPWISNVTCASDKIASVAKHFGQEWAARTIITQDKTILRADILADDKPNIHGSMEPEWVQLFVDQPYNRECQGPRVTDWFDWRPAFEEAIALANSKKRTLVSV